MSKAKVSKSEAALIRNWGISDPSDSEKDILRQLFKEQAKLLGVSPAKLDKSTQTMKQLITSALNRPVKKVVEEVKTAIALVEQQTEEVPAPVIKYQPFSRSETLNLRNWGIADLNTYDKADLKKAFASFAASRGLKPSNLDKSSAEVRALIESTLGRPIGRVPTKENEDLKNWGVVNPSEDERVKLAKMFASRSQATRTPATKISKVTPTMEKLIRLTIGRAGSEPSRKPANFLAELEALNEFDEETETFTRRGQYPITIQNAEQPGYELISTRRFVGLVRETYKVTGVSSLESFYDIYSAINGVGGDRSMMARFTKAGTSEAQVRFFQPEKLETFDDFIEAYETMRDPATGGSGVAETDGFELDTSIMFINYIITGEGRAKCKRAYNTNYLIDPMDTDIFAGDKVDTTTCLWDSVFSQIEYDEARPISKDCKTIAEFDDQLKDLYNTTILCYNDKIDFPKSEEIYSNEVIGKEKKKIFRLLVEESRLHVFYTNPIKVDALGYRSICPNVVKLGFYNCHFIAYQGLKPGPYFIDAFRKDLYRSVGTKKYEITKRKVLNHRYAQDVENFSNYPVIYTMVTFDVETRYEEEYCGALKPYSISWTVDGVANFYIGDDCIEKMLTALVDNSDNKLYCLLGYNSSRFDNLFLIPTMLKMDLLNSVFYQKSSLLNIKWGGRHTVHDICRFTSCTLDAACAAFKTRYSKVGGFDHKIVQAHRNRELDVGTFFHATHCPCLERERAGTNGVISVRFRARDSEEPYQNERKEQLKVQKKPEPMEVVEGETEEEREIRKKIRDTAAAEKEDKEAPKKSQFVPAVTLKETIREKVKEYYGCSCRKFTDLVEYNMFDVTSCEEIYMKIELTLKEVGVIGRFLFDSKTIGSVIFRDFKSTMAQNDIQLLEMDKYKFVRSGLFAGRTQCYKGIAADMTRKTRYTMLDVVSLYPYVMLNRMYPCGEVIEIPYEMCTSRGLIGFYSCTVNQSALGTKVIPLRSEKAPLDWNYNGYIEANLSTVDIACLIDAGATVTVGAGFAFEGKIRGDKLFSCLLKWQQIKKDEDVKIAHEKKTGTALDGVWANPVMRNMAKLFLNSLSGKVIENIHLDVTELVKSREEFAQALAKSSIKTTKTDSQGNEVEVKMPQLQCFHQFNDSVGVVSYKRPFAAAFPVHNRPIYLGVLIYAYARDHMYRSVLSQYDVIYQDTDSALMTVAECDRFKANCPQLIGSRFGDFATEAKSENFDSFITFSPKNYFILGAENPKPKDCTDEAWKENYNVLKGGFKGVNVKNDRYISNPAMYSKHLVRVLNNDGSVKLDKNGNSRYNILGVKGKPGSMLANAFDLYTGNIDYTEENKERARHGLPRITAPKSVLKDWNAFFNDIVKRGYAYVLTSNLQKSLREIATSGIKAGGVYQRFMLKKIRVCRAEDEGKAVTETAEEFNNGNVFIPPTADSIACLNSPTDIGRAIPKEPAVEVEQVKLKKSLNMLVSFDKPNNLRCDTGGPKGNRAFYLSDWTHYTGFLNNLIDDLGKYFNLNEYVGKLSYPTRTFIDIDAVFTDATRDLMICALESVIDSEDNKFLQSSNGKLHFVLDIAPVQPVERIKETTTFSKSGKTKKTTVKRTGEFSTDASKEGKAALYEYLKQLLQPIACKEMSAKAFSKAFDIGAQGIRAAYSCKMQGGKRISGHFYKPINSQAVTRDELIADIVDCSIYKPVTGKIIPTYISDIAEVRKELEAKTCGWKKVEEANRKMYQYSPERCEVKKSDGAIFRVDQELMNNITYRLPAKYLEGRRWGHLIRNFATVASVIKVYDETYVLHTWSKKGFEYNEDSNNDMWNYQYNQRRSDEDVAASIAYLMGLTSM